ncbi:MAG: 16S rRNA (guanine(527)-N(7))-methyltransferase RsmG [Candidatus Accumulibacter sp.]|nr:16S rRNA (guanine(527)-N(7))-methyltransferase RsmG [Accumulibacter sp.]
MTDLETLQNGIAELGLRLPGGAAEKLMAYRALFLEWHHAHKLTSAKHPAETMLRNLLDALTVVPWLDRAFPETAAPPTLLDAGSGVGLPGIPLALARPRLRVVTVDAGRKNVAFQQQAVSELELPKVSPRHGRVESLTGRHDIIIARYFCDLGNFIELTRRLIAPGGFWLAMKEGYPETELATLPAGIRLLDVETRAIPGWPETRHLVILTNGDA